MWGLHHILELDPGFSDQFHRCVKDAGNNQIEFRVYKRFSLLILPNCLLNPRFAATHGVAHNLP
jgi:hypothetical protein